MSTTCFDEEPLELNKITLVASSWGAALAVQLVAMYPSRFEHVFLLDGGYTSLKATPGLEWEMLEQNSIPEEAFESIDRYMEFVRSDDPSFWDEDIENAVKDQVYINETGKVVQQISEGDQINCLRSLWNFDPLIDIEKITTPITLFVSLSEKEPAEEHDFKRSQASRFQSSQQQCTTVILEDTEHLIMLHRPMELAEKMVKILNRPKKLDLRN